ncbi:MAG TPA: formate dehydrogenase accessory protein FdhE [Candidatus Acidoferrales bacterium]|nr:formate dehydrogenase accessory protein FdhE [Candidatus Acidoferrales bacterium]
MQEAATLLAPWAGRRRRAQELRQKRPFAAEVLNLYLALLDVQEPAYEAARADPPPVAGLAEYAARWVLPRVVEATVASGPAKLVETVVARFHAADLEDLMGRWLASGGVAAGEGLGPAAATGGLPPLEEQAPGDRYLARASLQPLLEALGPEVAAMCAGPRDRAHCPHCGGLPQLAYFASSGEQLTTGPRYLVCARCAAQWQYPRMTCAACGEQTTARLPIFEDQQELPGARIDACESCRRYLLTFDLRKDAGQVPLVDELASIPLDLYAKERGLKKVTPNLVGI